MKKCELEQTWDIYLENRDENAKKKLVEHYFDYVQRIASRIAKKINYKVEIDELASYGVNGLYEAISRFDRSKNVSFLSYSYRRIYGSIIDELRVNDSVPRSVRINSNKFEDTKHQLEQEHKRNIMDDEVAEHLCVTKQFIKNTKKFNPVFISSIDGLDENSKIENGNNVNLIDKKTEYPDDKLKRKEFFTKLLGTGFNQIERKIIYLHYYENYTFERIAEKIKISESGVSQIHKKLIIKMRNKIIRNPEYFNDEIFEFVNSCNDSSSVF